MLGTSVWGNTPMCQCCVGPEVHEDGVTYWASFQYRSPALVKMTCWSADVAFLRENLKFTVLLPSKMKKHVRTEGPLWRIGSSITLGVRRIKILKPVVLIPYFFKEKGPTFLFLRTPKIDRNCGWRHLLRRRSISHVPMLLQEGSGAQRPSSESTQLSLGRRLKASPKCNVLEWFRWTRGEWLPMQRDRVIKD